MRIKIILFILLISLSTLAFGQSDYKKGYLVEKTGNTITGFINYKGNLKNLKKCRFKLTPESEYKDYYPDDLELFRFEEENLYVSMKVEVDGVVQSYFIEQLIEGIVDVFYYSAGNEGFFLVRDDKGNVQRLENTEVQITKGNTKYVTYKKEYVGVLNKLFHDSPTAQQKVKYVQLNPDALVKLTKDYHNEVCSDYSCEVYSKKRLKTNFGIGVYTGISYSNYNPESELFSRMNNDFQGSLDPLFGFFININDPNLSERLSLQFGINTQKAKYIYDTISISKQYVKIPVSLKYTYNARRIKPYLQLGIAYNIWSSVDDENIVPSHITGSIAQRGKNQFGFFAGAGLLYDLSKSTDAFFQFRFERYSGRLRNSFSWPDGTRFADSVNTENNYLSVSVGVQF